MKKIIPILLAAVLLFSSCSNSTQPVEETTTSAVIEEPQPFPVTVNDVVFNKAPEKIVCLSPAIAEILYEMGYGEKIIGRSSYCDYPEAVVAAEDLGSSANPDIERIIQLAPDVVITSSEISSKDIFTMQQAGVSTLSIASPTAIEGFKSVYVALGYMEEGMFIGKEKGEQSFSAISKSLSNSDAINIGRFVYITENFTVATGDTLESAVLSCFGKNIAENNEGYGFSNDILLSDQPDYIFLNSKYELEDLQNDEFFSQLDAVMNSKVIVIDNMYFERPTGRITEMIKKMIDEYKSLAAVS